MSTSKHTFDQVKNILGKLDRAIDATRARRLDPARPLPAAVPQREAPHLAQPLNQPAPDPSTLQARPLRQADHFPNAPAAFAARPDFRRA